MPLIAHAMFGLVNWAARKGLAESAAVPARTAAAGRKARRTGVRGETYAYWYLRRQGYVMVARNFSVRGMKGEIDLVGYDGETLAFVEVRTRAIAKGKLALPELSISREKHQVLVRTAHAFLRERHVKKCPVRFDVVAIDHTPGKPPVVRLHKNALGPRG